MIAGGTSSSRWTDARHGGIGLRTLTIIRWIAVAGQLLALLVATAWVGIDLPLASALAMIGVAAAVNVMALFHRQHTSRLASRDAALYLAFDTLQLSFLLYLTGGLLNPFSLLLLAPLTVAAASLPRKMVLVLTGLVIAAASALAVFQRPLNWPAGLINMPPLYAFGLWLGLSTSAMFIALYVWRVADEARRVGAALAAAEEALMREQRLSAVGALAAAAAHELGSPLGTIAIIVSDLAREIRSDDPIFADIRLMRDQIDRCRDILAELARRPEADGGEPFASLTLRALIEAAASPAQTGGIRFVVDAAGLPEPEPVLSRSPEILHGLGNILHNAFTFAATEVRAIASWHVDEITITVIDDGPGFAAAVMSRIGEPYVSLRPPPTSGEHTHMGLGIFIAQRLLERTGATLSFSNQPSGGAMVAIRWTGTAVRTLVGNHAQMLLRAQGGIDLE